MANRLSGITIDCADPARMASFWSALLDTAVTGEHGDDAGWATVGSRLDDRPRLTFQRVAEPKNAKVRIHLDIQVMHDPEDHEFCLVQYYDCAT